MIDLMQFIGIAVCGLAVCIFLKSVKSETAVAAAAITCVILLLYSLRLADTVVDYIERLSARYDIGGSGLGTVFKVIGIGYICTFASQLCRDAGQASIGVQVELFGKLLVLVQALPIAAKLMDTLTGIL